MGSHTPLSRHQYLLAYLATLVLGLTAFGGALWNEYAYDSGVAIERMGQLPLAGLGILDSPRIYGKMSGVMSYRPLYVGTFILLDVHAFGAQPILSHLFNILLHVASACLLFRFVAVWFSREGQSSILPAAAAAGLLLLHPLVTEVVYCAGFRFDMWALFFLLLGLNLVVHAARTEPLKLWLWQAGAIAGCLLLALGGKEAGYLGAFVFPLCLLLLRGRAGVARASALFAVCMLVLLGFGLVWLQFQYPDYTREYLGGQGRLLGMVNFAVASAEVYMAKLVMPWPLRINCAFEPVTTFLNARVGQAAVLLVLAAALAFLIARKSRLAALGIVWVVLGFGPVSQITPVPDPVAERFWYVPMAGLAMFLAGAIDLWLTARPTHQRVAATLLILVGLAYVCLCIRRSWDWRDDMALNIANWEQPNDRRPEAMRALATLYMSDAIKHRDAGQIEDATASFLHAWENIQGLFLKAGNDAETHRLAALFHHQRGSTAEAQRYARVALQLAPENELVRAAARATGVLQAE